MMTTDNTHGMLFRLNSWEENRYDDSDGYTICWDADNKKFVTVTTWTTRGCIDASTLPVMHKPTREVVVEACEALAQELCARMKDAELRDVMEPGPYNVGLHRGASASSGLSGTQVRFLKAVNWKDNRTGTTVSVKAGETGEVTWVGMFGRRYSTGYNQPSRFNCRVGVRLNDGRVIFCSMEKVRLDRDPMSDTELLARARKIAEGCYFKPLASAHGGWLDGDGNPALVALKGPEGVPPARPTVVVMTDEGYGAVVTF